MANTNFTGPVRSENGFETVSKNTTTGAVTVVSTVGKAAVSLADGDVTLTTATHSGAVILVPDGGQDNTYTLPSPIAGAHFTFIYAGGAADGTDFIIDTGANANFFIGNVVWLDSDGGPAADEVAVVYPDGDSNSKFQVNIPGACEVHVYGLDTTNWQIWGTVTSATAPAFADQA